MLGRSRFISVVVRALVCKSGCVPAVPRRCVMSQNDAGSDVERLADDNADAEVVDP